ncbi:hypothetical protein SAY86_026914 [Trapa natans]|uniref:Uncharacterized protein n=1 Tax=Trapa natans TaxID=22666 RepID=A0AAN7KPT3_TRANT|nr:hypothetical protein SAY86_026914 [Trapa natans]
MSSSREQSPDWLRSFQAPIHSAPTVSSYQDLFLSDNSSEEGNVDCDKLSISEILHLSNKHTNQGASVHINTVESSKKSSKDKSPKK